MGRHQTEAAYLKSVLLWLQGNWAEPDPPRFYPLKEVEQRSGYYSVRRGVDKGALETTDITAVMRRCFGPNSIVWRPLRRPRTEA
jgi:hypothetical protein